MILTLIAIFVIVLTNTMYVSARELSTCSAANCGRNWTASGGKIPGFYIPPVEPKTAGTVAGGCVVDLTNPVSCSTVSTYDMANPNWTFTNNATNPAEAIQLQVNGSNLSFSATSGNTSLPITKGELYRAKAVGVNDGTNECYSDLVSFVCEDPRPTLCQNMQIINDVPTSNYFELSSTANKPVQKYVYAVYNSNNKDSAGNPKPVCVSASGGYQGSCPAGTQMLTFYDNHPSGSASSILRLTYDDVYLSDLNDSGNRTDKLVIKAFLSNPGDNNGVFANSCETTFSVSKIGYSNVLPAVNIFNNLGRFRKVGEWTVDMTPPEVNTPVTSNYLYDSFDTEWQIKTDTQVMDMNLGCYNLSSLLNYGVSYLGYLNDIRKYQTPASLFSNLNGSFTFDYKTRTTEANGNTSLTPPPFPNCVDLNTINAFKGKVNQPANLTNGGSNVSLKTKYKLEAPSNFENFQHVFKATDLACNTRVSQPGGAGIPLPDNWISTDGGTVFYGDTVAGASSPQTPQNTQKIDDNLYCSYDYNNPANSKIFFADANSDNSILSISKSLLLNDVFGKSYIGAKERDYKAGDDLLLNLYGTGATHYATLLNQIKSQTETVKYATTITNPSINTIADTGCDPASERCYIEVTGDLVINGDDGLSPINTFCNQNALFFVDGDLSINDNLYKNNSINSCCGFIVNGNINMAPTNPTNGYNRTRYQYDYLSRNNVNWYNTYECSTGFYYAEQNITVHPDNTNFPMSSSEVNTSDPLLIRGELLAKGNISQQRGNGIGNLSRPAIYLSKDACMTNNFPELSNVLLKTREKDFITDN